MDELERLSEDAFKLADKNPMTIVLDDVRSMLNVGSVFRSGDCFSAEAIYLCGYTPIPPHRDIQKSALGATETVPWKHYPTATEAVNDLKERGYLIFAIEQTHNSISLDQFKIEKDQRYAFVFGNEVNGVSDEVLQLCDGVIEIPQTGSKHSLNISVSAGIVLWEFAKQMMNA
ncbi:MAG: RNA methyltransferase [Chitinophagaceae bacterium]|nr:RNA methyltransferase [Chitinophagaceae bacterium]